MSIRPVRLRVSLACLVLALAAGPASAQDYYADIRPLLVENCAACHTDDGPGWSMDDPERTYERHRRIARAIMAGRMPPWLAEAGHQTYVDDLSLEEGEVALVERWAEAGFPEGEPRPDPERAHAPRGLRADLSLDVLPVATYLPRQDRSDDYRCFVVDWPDGEDRWITGFRTVPGNRAVAHHTVVHLIEPAMAARYRELEAEEDGAGYECFGGAVPDRIATRAGRAEYEARYPDGLREVSRAGSWLAHWAPGMNGNVFPEGTGIRVEPGSALVVQMHYYSEDAPGQGDAGTHIDFQLEDDVDSPALFLEQTYGNWLAGERLGSMVIPPGETVTYEYTVDLDDYAGYFARRAGIVPERLAGVRIHSANLHMHAQGHSGVITLADRWGRQETLLSVPRWDLAWQRDFTFAEPKVFARDEMDGTRLRVVCTFRNRTDETVYGGYGSDEEMCFNFSYVSVIEGEETTETGSGR